MRAVFVALTTPLTEATFGYSLFVSGLPQVMARALDDILMAKATTANKAKSFILISYFLSSRFCFDQSLNKISLDDPYHRIAQRLSF
jgi:hypothetical protein